MEPMESHILDSFQRTGVYIVRPGTYEVLYLNQMIKANYKNAAVGRPCYTCFGLDAPCVDCPLKEIGEKSTLSKLLRRETQDLQYDVTSTKIEWLHHESVFALCFNQHIFTKEERLQQKLEQRLSLVFRNTCDVITEINMETGEYSQTDFSEKKTLSFPKKGNYAEDFERFLAVTLRPEDQKKFRELFRFPTLSREFSQTDCFQSAAFSYPLSSKNGTVWAQTRAVYLKGEHLPYTFLITRDITTEKKLEALSHRNEELERERADESRYRIILQQTQTIVVEYNSKNHRQYISPFMSECLSGSYDDRELLKIWTEDKVVHPEDVEQLNAFFHKIFGEEDVCGKTVLRLRSKSGSFRWYKLISSKIMDETQKGMRVILTINDVNSETESGLSLRYRAEYDTLTGAYNKETFYLKTAELLHRGASGPYFIVRLDIDRFKVVNDLFGTQKGDLLLCFISDNIRRLMTPLDTYGRISGDVFCMCVQKKKEDVLLLIRTLMEQLDNYPLSFKITPSFGVYEVENRDTPVNIMCDWANLALKTVKGSYLSRYACYDDDMRLSLLREQQIISEMQGAMKNGQFLMYLQPKYSIDSSEIIGSEALVRWNHPKNGMIAPSRFIPLFEKNGLILELDRYIWECACRTLRRWLDEGKSPLPISVNVSRMHLYNPHLCKALTGLVHEYGLEPRLLELELTESAYTENPQLLFETMHRLQEQGFVFLMDDFGSGYSSLNMLKDIPVDILKIDMNFIKDTEFSERGRIILESTILMAQRLRLQVIAEGVETKEQAMFLLGAGCNRAQGYFYSKPIPVTEFEHLLFPQ